jgi:putative ABC transport system ATP-binding protein
MLSLKNITATLGNRRILNGLSLEVDDGEFAIIVGANGAGKSTLFNVICGSQAVNTGQIFVDGMRNDFAQVSRVFQDPCVGTVEGFTILENMALAICRHRRRRVVPFSSSKRREFFRERLAILGMNLENRMDDQVSHLSGGQRQALSLVMSITGDYKVLLLDEITAALDPKSSEKIMTLANKIVEIEHKTCLMITHNMNHALAFGDRILVLQNGSFGKQFTASEKKQISAHCLMDILDN